MRGSTLLVVVRCRAFGFEQNGQKQRCVLNPFHRVRLIAVEINPIARSQVDCLVSKPELCVPLDALEGNAAGNPVRGDLDTCRHDEAHRFEVRCADDGMRSGGGELWPERAKIDDLAWGGMFQGQSAQ